MKIALVHDWLNGMRGGEKILEVLAEIYPDARVFTLLYYPEKISPVINRLNVSASWLMRFPFVRMHYRKYLLLFPFAIKSFRLEGFDLVISVSHCVAKSVRVPKGIPHICYCLTPMRYVWDSSVGYLTNPLAGFFSKPIIWALKIWDKAASIRPDYYISISRNVADRVKAHYGRESSVVYPPADTDYFTPLDGEGGYYLIVSALVPYKRIDIAVDAFNTLKLPLKVIGTGTEFNLLKKNARENIEFLGWRPDEELRKAYAECKALIFPGIEDFGITVVEAQAAGRPVIAFAGGGALETVDSEAPTGIFFREQTPESLIGAVTEFERRREDFNKDAIRKNALRFGRGLFKKKIAEEIEKLYNQYKRMAKI